MTQNQDQYNSSGNITAAGTGCTLVNTSSSVVLPLINAPSISSVVVTVSGTFSGTLNFAATNAGLPFSNPLSMTPVGGGAAVTSATAPGAWTAQVAGLTVIGVYGSPFASGDALVTITSSTAVISGGGGGTISGTIATNQVAVGSGANTIAGSSNFTFVNSNQTLNIGNSANPTITMGPTAAAGSPGTTLTAGLFNANIVLSSIVGVILAVASGESVMVNGPSGTDSWSYSGTTGYTSWNGGTSGSAAIGVALVAGTPNPMLLPTTSPSSVTQVLGLSSITGGLSQLAWVTPSGGVSLIASGTAAMGTTGISTLTSGTVTTVPAAGVATTDSIEWAFNAAPGAGYSAGVFVLAYVTSGNVNFVQVNPTAATQTPAAATINWRVVR